MIFSIIVFKKVRKMNFRPDLCICTMTFLSSKNVKKIYTKSSVKK